MAAVAGSKGQLVVPSLKQDNRHTRSPQVEIVNGILTGEITKSDAIDQLIDTARLREVGIDTNMMCNLRCKYCYLDDRPRKAAAVSMNRWLDILTPAAQSGCKLFAFIGKEPLLDETATGVLEGLNALRSDEMSFRTGMVTNGTMLDRYSDRLLGANLNYLDISLDGLPDINDQWRGDGVAEKALGNLGAHLKKNPNHQTFVASVMHKGNVSHIPDFAQHVIELGTSGFFTSPILHFAENDSISGWAISEDDLDRTIERLLQTAETMGLENDRQIIIDLPYKYAWKFLSSGKVAPREVIEDKHEAPFWQPDPSLPVFVKMNVISFSFWKAVRITHDATVVENLDLAAHEDYAIGAEQADQFGAWCQQFPGTLAGEFHSRFFDEHLSAMDENNLHERAIQSQADFQVNQLV